MLPIAYWATLLIWLVVICLRHKKFHVYGINSMMLIGVVVPLLLYFADFSLLIDTDISPSFYLIFTLVNLVMIVYSLIADETLPVSTSANVERVVVEHIDAINIVFLALYALETYLLSGQLAPALHGRDIHTASFPIISFVTRNLAVPAMLDIICFVNTRRPRFLIYIGVLVLLPIVTRNARMVSFETIFAVLLLLVVLRSTKPKRARRSILNMKVRSLLGIACACVLAVGVLTYATNLTNERTISNGAVGFDYGDSIAYTGPLGNVGAVYYGYFPLSYNNLNLRLKYDTPQYNPAGFYSFASVWFGVLEFDNLFDISTTQDVANCIVTTSSATVPTAFWTYWYDYGVFGFIPVAVMVFLTYQVLTLCRKRAGGVLPLLVYVFLAYKIFFESFQNTYFAAPVVWGILILFVICKLCVRNRDES